MSGMTERKHLAPNQDHDQDQNQDLLPIDDANVGTDGASGAVGGLLLDLSQVASMSKKLLVMASQPLYLPEDEDDTTFSDELYEAYKGEVWSMLTVDQCSLLSSHMQRIFTPARIHLVPKLITAVQTKR